MGAIALTNVTTHVGGYDFTTDTNNALLKLDAEGKDGTTFGSNGWKVIVPGLKQAGLDLAGFWQSAASQAVDPEAFTNLGVADRVYTIAESGAQPASPVSIVDPARAYMFRGGSFHYEMFGEVGEVAPFKLNGMGTRGEGVVMGLLLKAKGNVSATGALGSTLDTLGFGVLTGQNLYVTFHVFTAATTITVQVQSDDNSGFSSPTTVATIGPITTSSGTWMTPVPGPITDRYLRLNVSAITGTFSVASAMGIR